VLLYQFPVLQKPLRNSFKVVVTDVNGDGTDDLILIGTQPGQPVFVKVYDGQSRKQLASLVAFPRLLANVRMHVAHHKGRPQLVLVMGRSKRVIRVHG
jgi:hypothetical protein